MKYIKKTDPEIEKLINLEDKRQKEGLEMIPSENYVSPSVLEAMGSILTNKYSEGYPKKRYYGGNENIDEIETLAQERAKKLFKVPFANVQPYSGSPANLAVYMATCSPGDSIMGLSLPDGGHLTHGWSVSFTGIYYKSHQYHVKKDGRVDFAEVRKLVKQYKPRLIWTGATAYVYEYEFEKFAEIADSVGAYFAADVAHTAGLIVAGVHRNPNKFVHIITTTTHKTLRGPRGAMIMVTNKGLKKDPELGEKINRAIFPGLQGGPHDHTTAAIAVALGEASKPRFKKYGQQILKNSKTLAKELIANGFKLVGDGTENHLCLIDLTNIFGPGGGYFLQHALDKAGITLNKNTIPAEPASPYYPSGVRLGTPALTTRGMKEKDMKRIAGWIWEVANSINDYKLPKNKQERTEYLKKFRNEVKKIKAIDRIKKEIRSFTSNYPIFAW